MDITIINIFHILIHIVEIIFIYMLIIVQCHLLKDYESLKSWVEFIVGLDLDYLSKRIKSFKKEKQ